MFILTQVTIAGSKRVCVFLNLSSELNKAWSTEGCSVVSSRTNSTTTTCACDHMTLFAVLMDASGGTVSSSAMVCCIATVETRQVFSYNIHNMKIKVIKTDQS